MKLKRLLLRYNPAGIGLECADEAGEISVIHKDLPKAKAEDGGFSEANFTFDEICELANTLIDGEPALLSKKKHYQAICQLLGRLYQIDEKECQTAEEKANKKKKKDKDKDKDKESNHSSTQADSQESQHGVFCVGDKVILAGLKPPHQGQNNYIGTVVRLLEKGKVEVVPEDGNPSEPIKLKSGPLVRVQDRPLGTSKPGDIPVGTKVAITRLRNHGALNGTVGRVVEFNQSTQRYEVRALETGQLFRVKPDNVVPLVDQDGEEVLPPTVKPPISLAKLEKVPGDQTITQGCIVSLCGLKNAAWLNGEEAEVLAVDDEKSRLDIRLKHDGSVKKVKSDNVKFVRRAYLNQEGGEFTPGQIVKLCGLRSAAALNGERAEIRRKDPGSDRYEIRLELDGSTKKVRRENLETL